MPEKSNIQFKNGAHVVAADGPLDRLVRVWFAGASWNQVRDLVASGKVSVDGEVVREPTRAVRAGSELRVTMSAPRAKGPALPPDLIVHMDQQAIALLVVAVNATLGFFLRMLVTPAAGGPPPEHPAPQAAGG